VTRLGFLLDSESCIGCHACTVACKSEHDVPLGVNRTWVKYIETGAFPNANRHFSVMRCNHCDNAPCVTICPTNALFRAANGVVDFDDGNCIGCKACMNACPYDAIYINPATNTANKCNFCNHRIEVGLEPSCVVVCPTHAIVVADLDDPSDPATALIESQSLPVRAPEQNTLPKVHYRGAEQASLDPLRTAIAADGMIWADTTPHHPTMPPATVPAAAPDLPSSAKRSSGDASPETLLQPAAGSPPDSGQQSERVQPPDTARHTDAAPAEATGVQARTVYTTAHHMTWKAKVSGYLVTKAVAAGMMLLAALLVPLGHADASAVAVMAPMAAGVFLAATGVLLVADLRQPRRFHYLLTRSNRRSWLVKGAYVLGAFAAVCGVWWIAGLAGQAWLIQTLALPAALLAAATAGYTALLFAQCEGRDLWQTPLLGPTLLAQAVAAGAGGWAIADVFMAVPEPAVVRWALLGSVAAGAILVWLETAEADRDAARTGAGASRSATAGEGAVMSGTHGLGKGKAAGRSPAHVAAAVRVMTRGAQSQRFWTGIAVGLAVPAALAGIALVVGGGTGTGLAGAAGAAALVGMWFYEDAFVRAGQSVPLS